jgi:uncharacterized protein
VLRSFRLANHKSIRTEQELLLLPVYDTDRSVQTVSAIYGANASGKSTLLDGLSFMRRAVRDSYSRWEPDQGVPRQAFRLDLVARTEPSHFVVDLELDGVRYTYGFSVDDEKVLEEWLYSYPEKKRRVIFERKSGDIKFGSMVSATRAKAVVLEELTRANALFLSVAARVNFTELLAVYDWFGHRLTFRTSAGDSSSVLAEDVAELIDRSPRIYQTIVELLRFADVGISGIVVDEVEDSLFRRELGYILRRMADVSDRIARSTDPRETNQLQIQLGTLRADATSVELGLRKKRLLFVHSSCDDPFDIRDESAGTRAWLDILQVVLSVLDTGGTLVVDEIDTSLHPALTARLLALFQSEETNPRVAQLICTTHDTTLLSPTLGEQVVTRGQVWFTEKNDAGETRLYPLSDFSPRKGENTERRYLGGSYGAVPRILGEDFTESVRESGVGGLPDGTA